MNHLIRLFFKSQLLIVVILTISALNALSAEPPPAAKRIVVIDKAKKDLVLFRHGKEVARFPAAFGIDPDSDKYKALDAATPEGLYFITYKKSKSRFHRFLGISYPNLANAARGLAQGVISIEDYKRIYRTIQKTGEGPCDTRLGCGLGIHGGGVFRYFGKARETDWTEGCIALNDKDIEKVFNFCRSGDPVIVFNSRRNLCGIIRPFTQIKIAGETGAPDCPNGVCTYQVEMLTSLGRMTVSIEEGEAIGRSIQVVIYEGNAQEKPLLILVDRNGDGYLSAMDSISGPIADQKSPDATYRLVREAVISALSRGEISPYPR